MKSMQPPKTVNEIYRLPGVWVKPTARSETGTAATYHTGARKQEIPKVDVKGNKKQQKDLSKVKCCGCGKKGHMKNSPLCPKNIEKAKKEKEEAEGALNAFMNATWYEECEGCMYTTVRFKDQNRRIRSGYSS
jgi:hypothetical protein